MNKTKPKQNTFDVLVGSLAESFAKIPNFDMVRNDSDANKLFNIVTFRIADIASYKELVISHYIPATNIAINNSKQMMRTSKFKAMLKISEADFQESIYQTLRLSYEGLFHKMESNMNNMLRMPEIFSDDEIYREPIDKYARRKFGFQFKDWQQFYATAKINWICNCNSHYVYIYSVA